MTVLFIINFIRENKKNGEAKPKVIITKIVHPSKNNKLSANPTSHLNLLAIFLHLFLFIILFYNNIFFLLNLQDFSKYPYDIIDIK